MDYEKKYVYIKDRNCFYSTYHKNRQVSDTTVFNAILNERKDLQNDTKEIQEILDRMKRNGFEYDTIFAAADIDDIGEDLLKEAEGIFPFHYSCDVEGNMKIYSIDDNNEATAVIGCDEESILKSIKGHKGLLHSLRQAYHSSEVLKKASKKISYDKYQKLLIAAMVNDPSRALFEEPKLISWKPDEVAFKQFDPSKLEPIPTPALDEILVRIDYPKMFLAWLWTVYMPENRGRQTLWIKGGGNDGKSTLGVIIREIFGKKYTASLDPGNMENKSFFYSTVYGKKFTVYSDCKNKRLISSGLIQSLTGGDIVTINGKHKDAFSGRVFSRLLVLSNYYPHIDFSKRNESSRIIVIRVSPLKNQLGDDNWEKRLLSEKWGILYKAKQAYEEYSIEGSPNLKIPDDLYNKMLEDCKSPESRKVDQFLEDKVEFKEGAFTSLVDLEDELKIFLNIKQSGDKFNFIYEDLENRFEKMGLSKHRRVVNGRKRTGFLGLRIIGDFETK